MKRSLLWFIALVGSLFGGIVGAFVFMVREPCSGHQNCTTCYEHRYWDSAPPKFCIGPIKRLYLHGHNRFSVVSAGSSEFVELPMDMVEKVEVRYDTYLQGQVFARYTKTDWNDTRIKGWTLQFQLPESLKEVLDEKRIRSAIGEEISF